MSLITIIVQSRKVHTISINKIFRQMPEWKKKNFDAPNHTFPSTNLTLIPNPSTLRTKLRLLPRILNRIILPEPDLRLALIHNMLDEHFTTMLRLVAADPARIPKLTGDS